MATRAHRAAGLGVLMALAGVVACGGAPPARERVARPCVDVAWIDPARGSLAVRYNPLGADAWLAIDLRERDTLLYGQDRLAGLGLRRADRVVLVPPLFGAQPIEMDVRSEPELPFGVRDGQVGFVIGRLGREVFEGRWVELDTERMRLCDRYADEVATIPLRDDATALAGPFTGRHLLVRVADDEVRVGEL